MRLLALLTIVATPALAATHHVSHLAHAAHKRPAPHASAANAPKSVGVFGDWQAATHEEAGQLVCYAFTRAKPAAAAKSPGDVILTVTERPGSRDAVAISTGSPYPRQAAVTVKVETTTLPFYTAGRSAFARDGKAAVAAFRRGREAVAHAPGSNGGSGAFSLRGFSAAYAAIVKACPAR